MRESIISRWIFILLKQLKKKHNGLEFLQRISEQCARFQGIGMGGGIDSSGETIVLNNISRALPDNIVLFDVGANVGKYSESLLSIFKNKNFVIHCFEPSHKTMNILKSNSSISFNKSVILNEIALGKCQENAKLYSDKTGSGLASLTKRKLDHFDINFNEVELCQVNTLDGYCRDNSVTSIDLLKIDVEGHELDVLEGSRNMFSNTAIKFVQFEFGGCNIDTKTFVQDFFYFFKPFDFEIYRITPTGYCQHLPTYKEVYEQFVTTNFLAVHRSIPFAQ